MAQKIFYNKHRKIPEQIQIFLLLVLLIVVFAPLVYFLGFFPVENQATLLNEKNIVIEDSLSVTIANRWLRLHSDSRQDVPTIRSLFHRYGKVPSWESTILSNSSVSNSTPKEQCFDVVYSKMSSSSDSALVFFLSANNNEKDDYAYALFSGFSFMETLAQHADNLKKKFSVFVVFSPITNSNCTGKKILLEKIEEDFSVKAHLIFSPSENTEHFSVTGLRANMSNPKWFSLLQTDKKSFSQESAKKIYKSFTNQWLISSLPFLQKDAGSALSRFVPALAWYYPATQTAFSSDKAKAYTKTFLRINDYFQDKNDLKNTSFFIEGLGMLRPFYFWLVVFFGFLFIWFHFINFAYFHDEGLEPVQGILSLLYFSLVPIFSFVLLKLGVLLGFQNQFFTLTVLFFSFVLYFFLKRIDDRFISAHANSFTSLLFFYMFLSALAWLNPVLFLSFVFVGIFLSRVKEATFLKAIFLLLLGFAIPAFLLYLLMQLYPNLPLFDASFITTKIFTSWGDFLPLAFTGGSLISLISRKN